MVQRSWSSAAKVGWWVDEADGWRWQDQQADGEGESGVNDGAGLMTLRKCSAVSPAVPGRLTPNGTAADTPSRASDNRAPHRRLQESGTGVACRRVCSHVSVFGLHKRSATAPDRSEWQSQRRAAAAVTTERLHPTRCSGQLRLRAGEWRMKGRSNPARGSEQADALVTSGSMSLLCVAARNWHATQI